MGSMEQEARRVSVQIKYNLVDITRDITPYVTGMAYTDGLEKADDLQVNLADPEGLWSGAWMPDKNARLTVDIRVEEDGQRHTLPCGLFFIDTVSESGPPASVSLKATSADLATNLRREEKVKAWEHVSLKRLFEDLAKNGNLKLSYLAKDNPVYRRIEQKKESDLSFAKRIAANEDLILKVTGDTLVVFEPGEFDAKPSVASFNKRDKTRVISWNLETQIVEAFNAVSVKYRSPQKKKSLEYVYKPAGAPAAGATLRLNIRCESVAQAQRYAKAHYERRNRHNGSGDITVMGDTRLVAGVNIDLDSSWGAYAGKYAVSEAVHSLWPYTTQLTIRRVD
jgi:phage protein D